MKNYRLFVVLIWSTVWPANCIQRRKINESVRTFHQRGAAIAVDNLIQNYEKEHQEFYRSETKNDCLLQWPDLQSKNLSDYCRKFLQHSVPTRSTENASGSELRKPLNYDKENTNLAIEVAIVHCKVKNIKRTLSYYMTRAPEPNCVYSLKCAGNMPEFVFNIINKYCNFENKPLIKKSSKRKGDKIFSMMRDTTGESIAKDKYLMQYELEHREMVKCVGKEGKRIEWSYATVHTNLDIYCYQYMGQCVPTRNREGVKGSWKTGKLHYQKLNIKNYIEVPIVICEPYNGMRRRYHMTRAPETNCVYALQRHNRSIHSPFRIIFKHCEFEYLNTKKSISQNYDIVSQKVYPKTEVKEEIFKIFETQNLLPKD